jgi:hypothetical protein
MLNVPSGAELVEAISLGVAVISERAGDRLDAYLSRERLRNPNVGDVSSTIVPLAVPEEAANAIPRSRPSRKPSAGARRGEDEAR